MKVVNLIQSPGPAQAKAKGAAAGGASFADLLAGHEQAIGAIQEVIALLAGGKVKTENLLQALEKALEQALSTGDLEALQAVCDAMTRSGAEAGVSGEVNKIELFSFLKEAAKDSGELQTLISRWGGGLPLSEAAGEKGETDEAMESGRRSSIAQLAQQLLKAAGASEGSKNPPPTEPLSPAELLETWKPTSSSGQAKEAQVDPNQKAPESLQFEAAIAGRLLADRAAAVNGVKGNIVPPKLDSQLLTAQGGAESVLQPETGFEVQDEASPFQQAAGGASSAGLVRSAVGVPEASQFHFVLRNAFAQRGLHTMNIKLSPPDLGPVHMKVQVRGEEVKALFITEAMGQKVALDRGLPSLRQGLADQGFSIQDLEVQVGADTGGDPSYQPVPKEAAAGNRAFLQELGDDAMEERTAQAPSLRAGGGQQHILDVMI